MASKDQLDKATSDFEEAQKDWEGVPDRLNSAVNNLKWVSPTTWAAVTGTRDDAQAKLAELFDKLKEAAEGIAAPFTFVERKAEWNSIAATVRSARNHQSRPEVNLNGYWEGVAKDRYSAVQGYQDQALDTLETMCSKVSDSFEKLSDSAFEFYSNVVTGIVDYYSTVAAAIAKIPTIVGAPFAVSDIVDAVGAAVSLMVRLIADLLKVVKDQMTVANDLKNISDKPFGFPDDQWPKSLSHTYSDASLQDDTPHKRDWAAAG
ncbi:hypothetical protein G4H71_09605 [Rhodococcus triatomae]|uniref:Proteins of 100 residues with WXG n=1 Tax=Rhodococcus triatomae TaxID=300028 RepID=A0A1G8HNA3_9NOCA|nr:hypothetical protein [Rhodococcus triatomae]QNG20833.1 hypothetical protein G4H72_20780 [Rhodococcus triatomae]QNG23252.1 hypothetical protein G4H71_09605 [Rhodococcus triatomae]SDI08085.1 hypothetical protein SAMN05444695_10514 [Rhodococcus triatomae]